MFTNSKLHTSIIQILQDDLHSIYLYSHLVLNVSILFSLHNSLYKSNSNFIK